MRARFNRIRMRGGWWGEPSCAHGDGARNNGVLGLQCAQQGGPGSAAVGMGYCCRGARDDQGRVVGRTGGAGGDGGAGHAGRGGRDIGCCAATDGEGEGGCYSSQRGCRSTPQCLSGARCRHVGRCSHAVCRPVVGGDERGGLCNWRRKHGVCWGGCDVKEDVVCRCAAHGARGYRWHNGGRSHALCCVSCAQRYANEPGRRLRWGHDRVLVGHGHAARGISDGQPCLHTRLLRRACAEGVMWVCARRAIMHERRGRAVCGPGCAKPAKACKEHEHALRAEHSPPTFAGSGFLFIYTYSRLFDNQ